jgi:uncharacterized protein
MASAELRVEVAYSASAGQVSCWPLALPPGSTVGDALERSGLFEAHPELRGLTLSVGIWGATRTLADMLRDRDRVEVYRPLRVDPKEARRQRHRSQRGRAARRSARRR